MQQRVPLRKQRKDVEAISSSNVKSLMTFAQAALAKWWKQKLSDRGLKRFRVRKFYLVTDSENEREQQVQTSLGTKRLKRK